MTWAGISAQSSGYATARSHAYNQHNINDHADDREAAPTWTSSSGYPNVCWTNAALGPARCSGEANVRTYPESLSRNARTSEGAARVGLGCAAISHDGHGVGTWPI